MSYFSNNVLYSRGLGVYVAFFLLERFVKNEIFKDFKIEGCQQYNYSIVDEQKFLFACK